MDTLLFFSLDELYLILTSYINDINDIYSEKQLLLFKNITMLTNNSKILNVPFNIFNHSEKLTHSSNNILFDIDNIGEFNYFKNFKNITSINFYINKTLDHEILSVDYFENLLKYLPVEIIKNRTVRLIFKTDDYYAYIINQNNFSILNLNQLKYIDMDTKTAEKLAWLKDYIYLKT